jgi:hypothetical protein
MKRYNLTFSKFGYLVEDLNGEWFRYEDSEDMNKIITEIADDRLTIIQERNLELETIKHNTELLNDLLITNEREIFTLRDVIRQTEFEKQTDINKLIDITETQRKSLKCSKIINALFFIALVIIIPIYIFPTIGI